MHLQCIIQCYEREIQAMVSVYRVLTIWEGEAFFMK